MSCSCTCAISAILLDSLFHSTHAPNFFTSAISVDCTPSCSLPFANVYGVYRRTSRLCSFRRTRVQAWIPVHNMSICCREWRHSMHVPSVMGVGEPCLLARATSSAAAAATAFKRIATSNLKLSLDDANCQRPWKHGTGKQNQKNKSGNGARYRCCHYRPLIVSDMYHLSDGSNCDDLECLWRSFPY